MSKMAHTIAISILGLSTIGCAATSPIPEPTQDLSASEYEQAEFVRPLDEMSYSKLKNRVKVLSRIPNAQKQEREMMQYLQNLVNNYRTTEDEEIERLFLNAGLNEYDLEAMKKEKPVIGMSETGARMLIGTPNDVHKIVSEHVTQKTYFYRDGYRIQYALTFRNGVLKTYQRM